MLRDRRPEVYAPLTAADEAARGLLVSGSALEHERFPANTVASTA
jgi:hypothetical protein